jgi:hypothetical protein
MQLDLSREEVVILSELLRAYLPELQREVARTDDHALRHTLVLRQNLCERLLPILELSAGNPSRA